MPKVQTKLVEIKITEVKTRFFSDSIFDQANKYYQVEVCFEVYNPSEKTIKCCVIRPERIVSSKIKAYKDFNMEYADQIDPKETRKESLYMVFDENEISKRSALKLLKDTSYTVYSSNEFLDKSIFNQLGNYYLSPIVAFIFGFGKAKAINSFR